jgi:signal transduction histidine kinase
MPTPQLSHAGGRRGNELAPATAAGPGRGPGRRFGLRARVTVAFGLGALLLSVLLAVLTYSLASSYLVNQREASTLRQAQVNARLVQSGLRIAEREPQALLDGLETPTDTESLLYQEGRWWATSIDLGPDELPADLRQAVLAGGEEQERFSLRGRSFLAVGVPLRAAQASYFEVFSLGELEQTLRALLLSLVAAGAVTTALGGVVGRWASGRALAPLRDVAQAAGEIAQGKLDTRLAADPDASLAALASSFNRMVDALAQRIERDARFASDVSHELRSPLTAMVSATDVLLARNHELPPRARQALDLLVDEVHRFSGLVEDLLEISRVDAGVDALDLQELRLDELAYHAARRAAGREVPIEVEAGLDPNELVVAADKRRLERVVTNLVANAESHAGGVRRLCVGRKAEWVRLLVDDAGPGVPADQRERIFDRFTRGTAKAGARGADGGSGLGLALAREHVRVHGGRLWVEDRPEGGARFVVDLPACGNPS